MFSCFKHAWCSIKIQLDLFNIVLKDSEITIEDVDKRIRMNNHHSNQIKRLQTVEINKYIYHKEFADPESAIKFVTNATFR